ncbi:MAG: hypothetical protein SO116_09320 [Treponema sp.]|nr:hypothetical protein [Spirochaetia bacterium]MDD7013859.1 hypothetical protein [Spirochaetales bacterium]MDY4903051.1 hypothetical protein [Treponema sp.]
MESYTLKSIGKSTDYMTIIRETEDGYAVRIVRDKDGYNEITNDFISKSLFESCIRTGYLTKIANPEAVAASA